jgi:hypothetical protein
MSSSDTQLDLISSSASLKEVTANVMFDAASPAMTFGRRASASNLLTWGYFGGPISIDGVITLLPNGTLALAANSANYVEMSSAGVVSSNTTGFTSGAMRLYTVNAGASSVDSYDDWRVGGNSVASPLVNTATYASTLTLDCSVAKVFDLTLTGNTVLSFSNGVDGEDILVRLRQDATGSRLVTFGAMVRFGTDITGFTASTAASKMDYITLRYNSPSTKYDFVSARQGY